ncbi:MAG: tetratricopeptide repeat protein, partial [Elusimicrobiota bacterium]
AHPVHVEEIALPSGIASPQHFFFLLLGVWAFLKSIDDPPPRPWTWRLASLAAYLCAILSKESAITGCALILITHIAVIESKGEGFPSVTRLLKIHAPFWILATCYITLRFTVLDFDNTLNFYKTQNVLTENPIYRFYTFLTVFAHGLRLLVVPTGLHPEVTWPVFINPFDTTVMTGALVALALLALAGWSWHKNLPMVTLGISWYFISYSPMSNLVAMINALFWEHWLYTPSFGAVLALAAAATRYPVIAKVFTPVAFAAALALGVQSFNRNPNWKDSETYFSYLLKHEPRKSKLWTNLGMAVSNKGREQEAIRYYAQAIALEDVYPETRHNLGNALLNIGNHAEAEKQFLRALEIKPDFFHSYLQLANLYYIKGDNLKAVDSLEKS